MEGCDTQLLLEVKAKRDNPNMAAEQSYFKSARFLQALESNSMYICFNIISYLFSLKMPV